MILKILWNAFQKNPRLNAATKQATAIAQSILPFTDKPLQEVINTVKSAQNVQPSAPVLSSSTAAPVIPQSPLYLDACSTLDKWVAKSPVQRNAWSKKAYSPPASYKRYVDMLSDPKTPSVPILFACWKRIVEMNKAIPISQKSVWVQGLFSISISESELRPDVVNYEGDRPTFASGIIQLTYGNIKNMAADRWASQAKVYSDRLKALGILDALLQIYPGLAPYLGSHPLGVVIQGPLLAGFSAEKFKTIIDHKTKQPKSVLNAPPAVQLFTTNPITSIPASLALMMGNMDAILANWKWDPIAKIWTCTNSKIHPDNLKWITQDAFPRALHEYNEGILYLLRLLHIQGSCFTSTKSIFPDYDFLFPLDQMRYFNFTSAYPYAIFSSKLNQTLNFNTKKI